MVASSVLTLAPLLLIFLSYVFILTAILRVPSAAGRQSPDTPGSPEGNTEGPGTASSEPLLPS